MATVVMIGNFDNYDTQFVGWTEMCARHGDLHVVLMDNSYGAQQTLTDRAKICGSNKHVSSVIAPVGGRWQEAVNRFEPELIFVEPAFQEAHEVYEWAETEGIRAIRSSFHSFPRNSLLF